MCALIQQTGHNIPSVASDIGIIQAALVHCLFFSDLHPILIIEIHLCRAPSELTAADKQPKLIIRTEGNFKQAEESRERESEAAASPLGAFTLS